MWAWGTTGGTRSEARGILYPRQRQMGFPKGGWLLLGGVVFLGALFAQRPFREYPGVEYSNFPIPKDYQEKTEWVYARLMYPPMAGVHGRGGFGGYGRFGGRFAAWDWTQGRSSWTTDYPRSDRHFSEALRRLTRVHTRSVEQPVNLDEGDPYDWPWLYAVEVGHWNLTDAQGKLLREFCLRGGFFMADDFHGQEEWYEFESRMKKAFPEYPIRDIEDSDAIFHTVYDLD